MQTPELDEAVELLDRAQAIVDAYLIVPVVGLEARHTRKELLKRLQAADHLAEAVRWVKQLDPDFSRGPSDGSCLLAI